MHHDRYKVNEISGVPVDNAVTLELKRRRLEKRARRFVKGPLDWSKIAAAACCHPRGLEVLLATKMMMDMTGKSEVALSNSLLEELGVSRECKRRALAALERAGLLSVTRKPGRLMCVTLKKRRVCT